MFAFWRRLGSHGLRGEEEMAACNRVEGGGDYCWRLLRWDEDGDARVEEEEERRLRSSGWQRRGRRR